MPDPGIAMTSTYKAIEEDLRRRLGQESEWAERWVSSMHTSSRQTETVVIIAINDQWSVFADTVVDIAKKKKKKTGQCLRDLLEWPAFSLFCD